jgi:predicted GTPase
VIEDGPTTTHGDMGFGAGLIAAKRHGAAAIIDPRKYAVGSIATMFETYTHLADVLPAMGYGDKQRMELRETIHAAAKDADVIVIGTPIDLARVLDLEVPSVRVFYDLVEVKGPTLEEVLKPLLG